MDINSHGSYPAGALSNFAPHPFDIDGIKCNSMEGFLQSLKFSNPEMQRKVCQLVGIKAKRKGSKKKWWKKQILYWQGREYERESNAYTQLINHAYDRLATNKKFCKALLSTQNATLTHSLGKRKKSETVLTKTEFIGNLTRIRNQLQKNHEDVEKW